MITENRLKQMKIEEEALMSLMGSSIIAYRAHVNMQNSVMIEKLRQEVHDRVDMVLDKMGEHIIELQRG